MWFLLYTGVLWLIIKCQSIALAKQKEDGSFGSAQMIDCRRLVAAATIVTNLSIMFAIFAVLPDCQITDGEKVRSVLQICRPCS